MGRPAAGFRLRRRARSVPPSGRRGPGVLHAALQGRSGLGPKRFSQLPASARRKRGELIEVARPALVCSRSEAQGSLKKAPPSRRLPARGWVPSEPGAGVGQPSAGCAQEPAPSAVPLALGALCDRQRRLQTSSRNFPWNRVAERLYQKQSSRGGVPASTWLFASSPLVRRGPVLT